MKPFLKVTLLLGAMVVLLLAAPAIASHLCGGLLGGMAALAAILLGAVLVLGLAIVGGGAALAVGLVVLLGLACAILAALLPFALPVLIVAGIVALILKLARRGSRPTATA